MKNYILENYKTELSQGLLEINFIDRIVKWFYNSYSLLSSSFYDIDPLNYCFATAMKNLWLVSHNSDTL